MWFAHPIYLLGLLVIPVLLWDYFARRQQARGALRFSDLGRFKKIRVSWSVYARHSVFGCRLIALILLILALARPQTSMRTQNIYTEGVDIILCMDLSSSMMAMDMDWQKRDRVEVSKEVVRQFIEGRTNDRIGLVVFAADAYTQCPMTVDYGIVLQILDRITILLDNTIEDGTAIGLGLARCVQRLKNSQAKSKVVVLLSDGENNRGEITPLDAARLAKATGIRVYTIGTGSHERLVPVLQRTPFGERYVQMRNDPIDEQTLAEMAEMTGGRYYRATDLKSFREIFREIDEMERTPISDLGTWQFEEKFLWFALIALILLGVEIILANTRFRTIP